MWVMRRTMLLQLRSSTAIGFEGCREMNEAELLLDVIQRNYNMFLTQSAAVSELVKKMNEVKEKFLALRRKEIKTRRKNMNCGNCCVDGVMNSDERNEGCDGERVGRSLYGDKRYIVNCLLNKDWLDKSTCSLTFNAFHLFCEGTIHWRFDSLLPSHRHNVSVDKIDFSSTLLRDIRSHGASIRYQSFEGRNTHQQFAPLPTEHEPCSLRHPNALRIALPRGPLRLRPTFKRKASKNLIANGIVFWQRQDFAVFAMMDRCERIDHSIHDQFLPQNFLELELTEAPRLTLLPPNSAGR